MTNLTLAVDADALRRARIRAVNEGTSVNARVREFINGYADGDDAARRRRAATEELLEISRSSRSGGLGDRTWTRDDLYER